MLFIKKMLFCIYLPSIHFCPINNLIVESHIRLIIHAGLSSNFGIYAPPGLSFPARICFDRIVSHLKIVLSALYTCLSGKNCRYMKKGWLWGGKSLLEMPGEKCFWGETENFRFCLGGGTDPGWHYEYFSIYSHYFTFYSLVWPYS